MLSTDRKQFESELAVLFGGFPQFLTPPRIEAYWRGLQKMPISTFTRCVDQALSESGSDKLPTVNTIWQLSRNLRSVRATQQSEPEDRPQCDPWIALGNRALFQYLKTKGGASEESLPKLIELKNQIIAGADDTSKPEEVRDVLYAAFDKVWEEMPAHRVEWHMEHYARTGRVHDAFAP